MSIDPQELPRIWRDRAIVVHLERKPPRAEVARFSGRVVEQEGAEVARKLRRWANDNIDTVAHAEANVSRPSWLHWRWPTQDRLGGELSRGLAGKSRAPALQHWED